MAKRKRRIHFRLSFELPEGATEAECLAYVEEAVSAWRGSLHPPNYEGGGDPMWGLDPRTLIVSQMWQKVLKR